MARLSKSVATIITRRGTGSIIPDSFTFLVFAVLIAALWAPPAAAQDAYRRVALVIGNSNYVSAPALPNPANDAFAMSDSLRRLGFTVQEGLDLDAAGMVASLRAFGAAAETADIALVFYAGHGIQVDGQNYLLPVDVKLERERDLNYEGMPLDLFLSEASQASKLAVVILDACRDNPFTRQLQESMGPTRSTAVGRGLGRVDAPADTLVAFATRDGAVAEDGTGFNSPYTTALLAHLGEPGVEIGHYFRRVRDTVVASTDGRQEPFVYGSLSADEFYLNPNSGGQRLAVTQTDQVVHPARQTELEADMLFWSTIQNSNDAAPYVAYLNRFPGGVFSDLARNRLVLVDTPDTDRGTNEVAAGLGANDDVATVAPRRRRIWNNPNNDRDDDDDDDGDDDGDDSDD